METARTTCMSNSRNRKHSAGRSACVSGDCGRCDGTPGNVNDGEILTRRIEICKADRESVLQQRRSHHDSIICTGMRSDMK